MRDINAFWFGKVLGPVHAACLRSFVRVGHHVRLHVYDPPEDVPAGIELFDASKLMARDEVRPHTRTGSFAFASDVYRYRILKAGMGIYADCDVFALKPMPDSPYLIGYETENAVNGAVLAVPADSEFVDYLNSVTAEKAIVPPWLKRKRRARLTVQAKLGFPVQPWDMPWGTFGPRLLTYAVEKFALLDQIAPHDVFYPLHHSRLALVKDPALTLADLVTNRSVALHLYNNLLGRVDASTATGPLREILASSSD